MFTDDVDDGLTVSRRARQLTTQGAFAALTATIQSGRSTPTSAARSNCSAPPSHHRAGGRILPRPASAARNCGQPHRRTRSVRGTALWNLILERIRQKFEAIRLPPYPTRFLDVSHAPSMMGEPSPRPNHEAGAHPRDGKSRKWRNIENTIASATPAFSCRS